MGRRRKIALAAAAEYGTDPRGTNGASEPPAINGTVGCPGLFGAQVPPLLSSLTCHLSLENDPPLDTRVAAP